ncbi:MAG: hypothetical protein ACKO34_06195 [Vampirovibrionales bacterium]
MDSDHLQPTKLIFPETGKVFKFHRKAIHTIGFEKKAPVVTFFSKTADPDPNVSSLQFITAEEHAQNLNQGGTKAPYSTIGETMSAGLNGLLQLEEDHGIPFEESTRHCSLKTQKCPIQSAE